MALTAVDHRQGAAEVERIALVGLPGTGKSAVARALARRRGWRAVDVDEAVERQALMTVAEVFTAEGEAGFRVRELAALTAVAAEPGPVVVACGGGIVTNEAARDLLRQAFTVVWLDAVDEVLLERLGAAADRPLLAADPPQRLGTLRAAREDLYRAVADLRVDVAEADTEEVADRLEDVTSGRRVIPALAPGAGERPLAVVTVDLGPRSYPVRVGAGIVDQVADLLPEGSRRVAVVTDRATLGLARRVLAAVRRSGRWGSITAVRGGEDLKTWTRAGRLVSALADQRLERGDVVIAVGGGTVGDVAGFAAAAYLRGIAVVHVPTTLLAMVDSAVGGKTGVNLRRGKNLAGVFWQPHAVLCDLDALRTLGVRPYRAAMAEIVKYAMILDDVALQSVLEGGVDDLLRRDEAALAVTVERCCALKAMVVGADERESGLRAILNYGHTAGHALEVATGFGTLLHGEAVAAGMRVAGRLSTALAGCPEADLRWQDELLKRCGLGSVSGAAPAGVLAGTRRDKKADAGVVRWVLVDRRGHATTGHAVPDAAVLEALAEVLVP